MVSIQRLSGANSTMIPQSPEAAAAQAMYAATQENTVTDTTVEYVDASTDTATAQAITSAMDATDAAATPEVKAEEMPKYVAVPMTPELWDAIQQSLPEKTPVGTYLRTLVAEKFGVTVVAKTRSKYATDEERKAAQKATQKSRADLIKELMAAHKAAIAAAAAAKA